MNVDSSRIDKDPARPGLFDQLTPRVNLVRSPDQCPEQSKFEKAQMKLLSTPGGAVALRVDRKSAGME